MQSHGMTGVLQVVGVLLLGTVVQSANAALSSGKGTVTSGGTDSWGTTYTGAACIGDGTGGKSGSGTYTNDNGCVPYVTNIDDDGDGMQSTWEQTYRLNKYNSQDRYMDIDADGSTNVREYKQGSAPTTDVYGNPANPTDTDGDGIPDSADPNPAVAGSSQYNLDNTYKGIRAQQGSNSP